MRRGLNEVVAELAADGVAFFTVPELAEHLEVTRVQAQKIAYRMAQANLARRLRRGVYALLPPADWTDREGFAANWYLAAAALAGTDDHFLAYYTAMELHGMIAHPLRTVFIAATRRHANVRTGPVRFRFVTLTPQKFFGAEDRQVEPGQAVRVASLERTFIDCIDRLDLCGGIEEVFRGLKAKMADINADRLVRFVQRFDRPPVTKRLGFLLELAGYPDREIIWELERLGGRLKRFTRLDETRPAGEDTPRDRKWELMLNVDPKALLAATRT
jgi:predicted transcriptional regulator of viral defense system